MRGTDRAMPRGLGLKSTVTSNRKPTNSMCPGNIPTRVLAAVSSGVPPKTHRSVPSPLWGPAASETCNDQRACWPSRRPSRKQVSQDEVTNTDACGSPKVDIRERACQDSCGIRPRGAELHRKGRPKRRSRRFPLAFLKLVIRHSTSRHQHHLPKEQSGPPVASSFRHGVSASGRACCPTTSLPRWPEDTATLSL